jgi:hypothetical protein
MENVENYIENYEEKWNEVQIIVDSLRRDISKNIGGNVSAGVRSRRGLRILKNEITNLVKKSIIVDKARKEKLL